MLFVETPVFTREIVALVPDETYRALQTALLLRPEAGDLIVGSGGLRKIRWAEPGRGKRGGLRVIYYWDKPNDRIYMLFPFRKTRSADLTKAQIAALRAVVEESLK